MINFFSFNLCRYHLYTFKVVFLKGFYRIKKVKHWIFQSAANDWTVSLHMTETDTLKIFSHFLKTVNNLRVYTGKAFFFLWKLLKKSCLWSMPAHIVPRTFEKWPVKAVMFVDYRKSKVSLPSLFDVGPTRGLNIRVSRLSFALTCFMRGRERKANPLILASQVVRRNVSIPYQVYYSRPLIRQFFLDFVFCFRGRWYADLE